MAPPGESLRCAVRRHVHDRRAELEGDRRRCGRYEIQTTSTTCGPGIVAVEVSQDPIEQLTYITQTPIDDELTEVNLCFSMKALPDEKATESIGALNDRITNEQFAKTPDLGEQDLPRAAYAHQERWTGNAYRRWFRQFYSGSG